jgi:hypothetical protein
MRPDELERRRPSHPTFTRTSSALVQPALPRHGEPRLPARALTLVVGDDRERSRNERRDHLRHQSRLRRDLSSSAYATEFDQVKSLGAANSTTRTADQTAQALFWADHAVAMWDRIFRQLSQDQHVSTAENARFFAMMFLTSADAIIACQQDKARWLFWRPQTAIREAATGGNPATVADPTWTSLLGNSPYPDHPSGHNCASSAIVHTLRDFFGTDRMSFSATRAVSPIGPITRSYSRFSQALDEIRLARVYGGIHFMTADAAGASLGRKVAKWREGHALQPVA